jgi:hypothetical protein
MSTPRVSDEKVPNREKNISSWGYLGKREDVTTTFYTTNIEDLNKVEEDPNKEITQIYIPMAHPDGTGSLLMVQYRAKENKAGPNGNIVLGMMSHNTTWQWLTLEAASINCSPADHGLCPYGAVQDHRPVPRPSRVL